MNIPEGMTASKLRAIADWLDLYDKMGEKFVVAVEGYEDIKGEAIMALRGKGVQDDLRRWADAIDSTSLRADLPA